MVAERGRPILVCADDFGLHPLIDRSILTLAEMGRLSGASCLVDGVSFGEAGRLLDATGVMCGLHLNFTEPTGTAGPIMPLGALIRACWLRRVDRRLLVQSITGQLERYESVMGRAPDYIDGHQHVHQFPCIREALLHVVSQRYAGLAIRPWIRSTVPARQTGIPLNDRLKAHVISLLGARKMRRLTLAAGFNVNSDFLGVYGFEGGEATYAAHLRAWLAEAKAGTVIMCHPALKAVPGDPIAEQRVAEFRTWRSDALADWLWEHGLTIGTREHTPL